jgi:predicted HAD superfamily phosphohydrolase YqeG
MSETLVLRKKMVKRMYQLTPEETLQNKIDHLVTLSLGSCLMGNRDNQFSRELNQLTTEMAKKGYSTLRIMRMVGRRANKYHLAEENYRITHKQII